MLRGRRDDGTWTDRDRIMALALTMYEDSLCSGCGGHHSMTHGDENVGRWGTGEDMCHLCAAIESAQEQEQKDKNGYPGKKLTVIDVSGD